MIELVRKSSKNAKNDILSGLTVALALVPEAVAFAFVAGIDPLVGLYGAFMMGIITAIFGGRPGMISGATGAMAVVMVGLIKAGNEIGLAMEIPVEGLGLQYLFLTLLLVGIIQFSAGLFKLGKFVRLIPHSVMMGFVNGLAIVIFWSQIGHLFFPHLFSTVRPLPLAIFFQNDQFLTTRCFCLAEHLHFSPPNFAAFQPFGVISPFFNQFVIRTVGPAHTF